MKIWLIILSMTIVTYIPRLLPLIHFDQTTLPEWVHRSLTYVPIAMLSALVGVAFLPSRGWLEYTLDAHLLAGLVAVALAWRTHSVGWTILGGMTVLLLFEWAM